MWSGNVAAGANEAIIACPLVRQTSLVAGLGALDAHPGRRETPSGSRPSESQGLIVLEHTDLTPSLLSIRRASIC